MCNFLIYVGVDLKLSMDEYSSSCQKEGKQLFIVKLSCEGKQKLTKYGRKRYLCKLPHSSRHLFSLGVAYFLRKNITKIKV
jgi:hypothetical protein